MTITTLSLHSQSEHISSNTIVPMQKHEIGFSVGAFPLVGFLSPPNDKSVVNFGDYMFAHSSYIKKDNGSYEKMYHFGSYSLNYNYHFNSINSIGTSLSWVGRHIERYEWTKGDTINGSGWLHYLTLQLNYRCTYYRKNVISLYFGIHCGIVLCARDKDILYKETQHQLLATTSNNPYYVNPAFHFNAFGIDIGTKHILNTEIGIGTQGIFKIGYKYKFFN